MNEQTLGVIITSIAGIFVALLTKTDVFRRKHALLMKDIELYNALPPSSVAKDKLLNSIDRRIIAASDTSLHRNLTGAILGLLFLVWGGYLTWYFWDKGSLWRWLLIVSIFVILLGIVMFKDGYKKAERDDKGNIIKKPTKSVKLKGQQRAGS